jgi:hypothetical protein
MYFYLLEDLKLHQIGLVDISCENGNVFYNPSGRESTEIFKHPDVIENAYEKSTFYAPYVNNNGNYY